MDIKTLYGLDKGGKYKVWTIWTDGDQLSITHGQEHGKMQTKQETVAGKNIGRANETTGAEQAELEAMSRWRKQQDKCYRETKEELSELPLLPMLAHDYLKQGHRITFPCYGSAKMDGVRCLAVRHPDRVELKSRGGKEYLVKHVQDELMHTMLPGEVWDGELYVHGEYLESIVSATKKPNELTPQLVFRVFDVVSDKPFARRIEDLNALVLRLGCAASISILPYQRITSEEDMKAWHKVYVGQGYEGIMLRNDCGMYESGKRSADLQKYKEFFDEEFRIVAVGSDRNDNAVLCVYDPMSGETFNVCCGDFEERKRQLTEWTNYVGKALTVKYQTRYKDSLLPQFPTGVMIRQGLWEGNVFIPTE